MSVPLSSIAVSVAATFGLISAETGRAEEWAQYPNALELGRPALPALSDATSYRVPPRALSWSAPGRARGLTADPAGPQTRETSCWAPVPCGGAGQPWALDLSGASRQPTISGFAAPGRGSPDWPVQSAETQAPRPSGGIGGTRLRASISVIAPDAVNAGLFYPVNDRLTIGVLGQSLTQERTVDIEGQLIDPNDLTSFIPGFSIKQKTTAISFGPFAQVRILREQRNRPSLEFTAYSLEWGELTSASTQYSDTNLLVRREEDAASVGEPADKYRTVFFSSSKRLQLSEDAEFLRGVRVYGGAGFGARTGKRYTTVQTGAGNPLIRVVRDDVTRYSFVGWAGAEISLPERLSLFGEFFTGDECVAGYTAGLRWTGPIGITVSIGFSNCLESAPQRALDLVYLPGGVGGQPSVVSSGGGSDSGGVGRPSSLDEDE